MKFITVDHENNAIDWWEHARERAHDLPPNQRALIEGDTDSVMMGPTEAMFFLVWCESLPGWDNGPAWASTALIFRDYDPED